ncbi:ABC transporter ATP-binding protein [Amylibacter sp. IMCC11727]|uniref:ABC transporter ATP-binding protein n=1 Tax=Amylibacter sp. IMCC11727 TaxID=3039851 RepID=UPI00244DC90F|nr:ABC transporter ATP-binding protein [Amylibacter sp. IMCC11727]WGI21193.1 ABC transporter ATP-binding protein [Amylibacter sp. IMCC11727]
MYRFFENLVNPYAKRAVGTPSANIWAFIRSELHPFRRVIPWMLFTSLAVALMETWLISYSGRVIDYINNSDKSVLWNDYGWELLGVALFILFARPLAHWITAILQHQTLSGSLRDQVRWRAHTHLLGQSRGFFHDDFAGRLANRVMQVGPAVEDNVFTFFDAVWFVSIYFLSALWIMTGISGVLALPMVLWLGAFVLYIVYMGRKISAASEDMSQTRSMVTARVVDAYTNIESVKLFSGAAREQDFALEAAKADLEKFRLFLRLWSRIRFDLNILTGILIVGVIGLSLYYWTLDLVTIGEISIVAALVMRLSAMTGWIMWVSTLLFENAGKIHESMDSLARPQTVVDADDAPALEVDRGEIRFVELAHHYGKDAGGLNGLDLTIAAGEKVGLVGRSGAGKTTLVNLLLRFMDPETGRIEIDGQDISGVQQETLRGAIGMVTQEPSLMHRSVRDNIMLGRPDADDGMIASAVKRADAADFIPDLEDPKGRRGMDAYVGERGVKLSGGQRQRIALARVVLKDAPILVLDEATSALDSESEAAIQDALSGVMQGKTVIAIAHRLSTIARMDRIVVLDDGKIAEIGTHQELLAKGGLYAGFWARQSGEMLGLDEG